MEGPVPEPTPSPGEPEVEDRIPLEPEQLQRELENRILGQPVARVVCFRSTMDQRERYAVVMESGACLLFAPDGQNLVMTLIKDVRQQPTPEEGD